MLVVDTWLWNPTFGHSPQESETKSNCCPIETDCAFTPKVKGSFAMLLLSTVKITTISALYCCGKYTNFRTAIAVVFGDRSMQLSQTSPGTASGRLPPPVLLQAGRFDDLLGQNGARVSR